MKLKNKYHLQSGFTLIEILMAIVIFSIITAGVAAFSAYYMNNYAFSYEENQSIGIAQSSFTRMIRDVREARQAEDGSWPMAQADDNTLIFYADVTGDGRADRVRYFLDGSTLKKGVIEPTVSSISYPVANEKIYILATNTDATAGPIFRYYNGNWPADQVNNPLPATNRIYGTKSIIIFLRINVVPGASAQPFELTSGVTLRNLKDNL